MNTTRLGNDFAEEIANIYKLMGYDVTVNIDVDGQQVDILVSTNIAGAGLFNQIVECKYKSNNVSVSNDDVQSIAKAFAVSKMLHNVNGCVLVTNSNFSLKAKEIAEKTGVVLKTKDELIYELINFKPYLNKVVTDFTNAFTLHDKSWYIHSFIKKADDTVVNLVDYVDQWLALEHKSPLAIKGSYGSGKSSFCIYYAYKLITSGSKKIPVIIQLRDYQRAIKIEDVIRDFLLNECEVKTPRYDVFNQMFDAGNILLFFDGFDEMAAKVDPAILESNLMEIEKFSARGNVILTCRPEYFVTEKEEKNAWIPHSNFLSARLSTYQVAELQEWKFDQVTEYVEKRLQFETDKERIPQCLKAIENLPELGNLSSRAVHLELIVKMLPIMFSEDTPINRPNLYKTYIDSELMREVVKNKRLRLIPDSERFDLMIEVAAINHLYDRPINFEQVSQVIANYVNVASSELEAITRDFLNRSFLVRKGDNYFFAHKSIAEFLVALKIKEQILLENFAILDNNYNRIIASMVVEMLGGIENLDRVIGYLKIEHHPAELSLEMFNKYSFFAASCTEFLSKIAKTSREMGMLAHDHGGQIASVMCLMRSTYGKKPHLIREDGDNVISIWGQLYENISLLNKYRVNDLKGTIKYVQHKGMHSLRELLQNCIIPYFLYEIQIQGPDVVMLVDKETISRIFGNIISNATKAMGESGVLTIKTSTKKHFLKKKIVQIVFTNNGPKIPSERLDKIFLLGWTTTASEDGSSHGMGLFIVKTLLQEIEGKVSVVSTDESTSFIIELPVNT